MADTDRRNFRILRVSVAIVCIVVIAWSYANWRNDNDKEKVKAKKVKTQTEIIKTALERPLSFDSAATTGPLRVRVVKTEFVPDLTQPDQHLYVIATLEATNVSSASATSDIACRIFDANRNAYQAIMIADVDISDRPTQDQLEGNGQITRQVISNSLTPGVAARVKAITDIENAPGEYLLACQTRKDVDEVIAWKMKKNQ